MSTTKAEPDFVSVMLVGEPASGKSTVACAVMSLFRPGRRFSFGLLRGCCVDDGEVDVYFLGIYEGGRFDGTDRLSMAVQPDAEKFVAWCAKDSQKRPKSLFFEGDRLGNSKFYDALSASGSDVNVFRLVVGEEELERRHLSRKDTQTKRWLSGRRTKIERVVASAGRYRSEAHENGEDTKRVAAEIARILRRER